MAETETLGRIVAFIRELGIEVTERSMWRATLVPGIDIERGGLVVEEALLCKPADLLHEAGHIALTLPADRDGLDGTINSTSAEELSAIAWTWAAALHLGLEPSEVFHEEVISGNGSTLLENFVDGRYVGVPMLQRWGLAKERSATPDMPAYPHMIRWTRE